MKYFIRQLGEKDCGITCLKMLWAKIYKNNDFLFYPEKDINKSYSLSELMKISKNEGVELSAYKLNNLKDIKKLKKKNIMLVLKESNNSTHMVLVDKIKRFKIIVKDPKRGRVSYRYNDLDKIWDGVLLEAISIKGSDFKIKNHKMLSFPIKFILNFLQIIIYSLFALALYFTDNNVNFLVPLFLFLSFILLSIAFQQIVLLVIKKVDKKLLNSFCSLNNNFKKNYADIVNYKKLLIVNPISLFSNILITIFSIVVLGINSYLNLISIGLIFALLLILKFVGCHFLKNKELEIEKKEKLLKDEKINNLTSKNLIIEINNLSYELTKFESLKKYIIIFVIIITTLFLASLENQINLNFILFYFFAFIFISENLQKIINYDKNIDDLNYYKSLFFYYSNNA